MKKLQVIRSAVAGSVAIALLLTATPDLGIKASASAHTNVQTEQEQQVSKEVKQVDASGYELMDQVQGSSILHCWNWSYKTIEEHMDLIAQSGYTAIQTSPAQQPKDYTYQGNVGTEVGYPGLSGKGNWWKLYQPVTFNVCDNGQTWLGTKEELKSMCKVAEKYGIKVIVDIVANHMGNITGWKNALSDVSPQVGEYWNKDMLTDENFWHINDMQVWMSDGREHFTQGTMGMPDLNTANKKVQQYVYEYLDELIDCGVDGFRFDAAKHIETPDDDASFASDFWPTVLNEAKSHYKSLTGGNLYVYGEILNTVGDNFSIDSYTKYMSVTDNSAGNHLLEAVRNNNVQTLSMDYASDKSVLWAESHDTYMNESSRYASDKSIVRTWAMVANKKDAAALFFVRPYASKDTLLDDRDGSVRSNLANVLEPAQMGACETYVWASKEVAAINHFNNRFASSADHMGTDGQIMYCQRGNGIILVNFGGAGSVSCTAGGLADGSYRDEVSGNTFTVSGGKVSGNITSEYGVAVLYNNTMENPGTVYPASITASVQDLTTYYDACLGLKVTVKNADTATYQTSAGESGTISGTERIQVGNGVAEGETFTVTITAKNALGSYEKTFTYKKGVVDLDECIFFTTAENWTHVNAYAYAEVDKVTGEVATGWPGFAMFEYAENADGTVIYGAQIPELEKYNTINFNNGVAEIQVSCGTYGQLYNTATGSWIQYLEAGAGKAKITASVSSKTIVEPTSVTFAVTNGDSAVYMVDDGPETAFTDSITLTVGEGLSEGQSQSVTIRAKKEDKVTEKTFIYTMGENKPVLQISPGTGELFASTLDVEISAENVTEATYSVEEQSPVSFSGTKTITIGETAQAGDMVTVTVTGKSSNGKESTVSATYVKGGKSQSNAIYFKNTQKWGKVNAYVWESVSKKSLAQWPGSEMTLYDEAENIYMLEIEAGSDYNAVIFSNNGTSQTKDLSLAKLGQLYDYSTGDWSDYSVGTKPTIQNSTESGTITGETEITLTTTDAEKCSYKLTGQKEVVFDGKTTVKPGEFVQPGDTVTLVVKAVNGDQITVAVYTYTREGQKPDQPATTSPVPTASIPPVSTVTPDLIVTENPDQTATPFVTEDPSKTPRISANPTETHRPGQPSAAPTGLPQETQLVTQNPTVSTPTRIPSVTENPTTTMQTKKRDIPENAIHMNLAAEYTGEKQMPDVEISGLTENKDFTVSYEGDFIQVGTYQVIITGKGDYQGSSVEKTFTICLRTGHTYQTKNYVYQITNVSGTEGTATVTAVRNKKAITIQTGGTVNIGGAVLKVTAIGPKAFANCKKLKAVAIGPNLKKIGKQAFYKDSALKKIYVQSLTLESVGTNAIKGIYKKAVIKVPKRKWKEYKKQFTVRTGFGSYMRIRK